MKIEDKFFEFLGKIYSHLIFIVRVIESIGNIEFNKINEINDSWCCEIWNRRMRNMKSSISIN